MAEILPIRRKTPYNQSMNQSINQVRVKRCEKGTLKFFFWGFDKKEQKHQPVHAYCVKEKCAYTLTFSRFRVTLKKSAGTPMYELIYDTKCLHSD